MEIGKNIIICPYCGQLTNIVWVHGHGQCMVCKSVIDECCRGENQNGNNKNDFADPDNCKTDNNNKKPDENENK